MSGKVLPLKAFSPLFPKTSPLPYRRLLLPGLLSEFLQVLPVLLSASLLFLFPAVPVDEQIVKKRIEGGANEKAVLRLFINCPFVCINFDFFWLNKARQLYMDF